MTNPVKLVIKILNEPSDRVEWVHLAYIDKNLYDRFLHEKNIESTDMNEQISRWAKEDFNIELSMSSSRDLYILRGLVKDFYKRAHPELFIDSVTDRQGWIRVWITKKMREELRIYGEECF